MKKQVGKWIGVTAAVAMSFSLIACKGDVPSNMTKGRQKMENEGYEITIYSADEIADMFEWGGVELSLNAKTAILCEKEVAEDALLVIWFETKEDASDFKTIFKKSKDYLEDYWEDEDVEIEYKVAGTVFYFGTEQACEDFVG